MRSGTATLESSKLYIDCFLADEEISYQFKANGAAISTPPFSEEGTKLTVQTSDASHAGTYAFVLEASVGTPGVDQVTATGGTFTLEIEARSLIEPAAGLPDITYNIQDAQLTSSFDPFRRLDLSAASEPVIHTFSGLPSFVTFDNNSRTFTLQSNNNADASGSPFTVQVLAFD